MSPPPAQIVALQLLALDAEHCGDDAQKRAAFTVIVNADADDVLRLAKLRQVVGKAFLHGMVALIHDEGDHTADIAAALQKIFQLIVQVFGVFLCCTGTDHNQIPGRLYLAG